MVKRESLNIVLMLFWVTFFLAYASQGYANESSQTCPDGHVCITNQEAMVIAQVLDHHNCLVETGNAGGIVLEWEPIHVIATHEGQYMFAEQDFFGTLSWCQWELELHGSTDIRVFQKKEDIPEWGFRLRIKLGLALLPTQVMEGLSAVTDPVLLLEPFYWKLFHIQAHVGIQQAGLSVGMDLTKNMDVFAGVGLSYREAHILPVVGISLSFN